MLDRLVLQAQEVASMGPGEGAAVEVAVVVAPEGEVELLAAV